MWAKKRDTEVAARILSSRAPQLLKRTMPIQNTVISVARISAVVVTIVLPKRV